MDDQIKQLLADLSRRQALNAILKLWRRHPRNKSSQAYKLCKIAYRCIKEIPTYEPMDYSEMKIAYREEPMDCSEPLES